MGATCYDALGVHYWSKDKPELLDLGEKHYIQKPFQTEVLLERVRFMLVKEKH